MPSKTSSCSKALFLRGITAFWPVWVLYTAIWVLLLPFYLLTNQQPLRTAALNAQLLSGRYVLETIPAAGLATAMIFSVLSVMAVFAWLCLPRAAAMYHGLPIRRTGMFASHYLAGLSFLLVPNLFVFLLTLGAEAILGYVNLPALLTWLGAVSGMCVFFYSLAVLTLMITGSLLALPVLYGVFQILFVGMELLIRSVLSLFVFGFATTGETALRPLSPAFELSYRMGVGAIYDNARAVLGYQFSGGLAILLYALAGVALSAGALLLYRRRHTEAAGDLISVPVLRPVFKYAFSFCVSLTLGMLIYGIFSSGYGRNTTVVWPLLICALIAGLVGYFAAEMMLRKSFRVLRTGWKGYCVFAAGLILLAALSEFGFFGFESRMPAPDQVATVSLGWLEETDDPALIARVCDLHSAILQTRQEIEAWERQSNTYNFDTVERSFGEMQLQRSGTSYFRLTYLLKSGKTMTRIYTIPITRAHLEDSASPAGRLQALQNDPAFILAREMPEDITMENVTYANVIRFQYHNESYRAEERAAELGKADTQLLLNAMRADFAAGRFGRTWLLQDEQFYQQESNVEITIYFETNEARDFQIYASDQPVPMPTVSVDNGVSQRTWTLQMGATETIRTLVALGAIEDASMIVSQWDAGGGRFGYKY